MRTTFQRMKKIVSRRDDTANDTAEASSTGQRRGPARTLIQNVLHPQIPRRRSTRENQEATNSSDQQLTAPETLAAASQARMAPRIPAPSVHNNRDAITSSMTGVHSTEHVAAVNPIREKNFIDPAEQSKKNEETKALALSQTIAARKLLYFPKQELCDELKKAAEKLKAIIFSMTNEELQFFMSFNFGTNELLPEKSPEILKNILERIIDIKSARPTDRAVLISIMGMIGKEYMGAAKQNSKGKNIPPKKLKFMELFSKQIYSLKLPSLTNDLVNRIRLMGDSEALAPKKREEQPEESKQENAALFRPRAGVHDLGEEADKLLGIDVENRIPKVTWQLGEIEEKRVSSTIEPMVDHISGRAARTLMIWDLLCGEHSEDLYKGALDTHQQEIIKNPERKFPMEHLSPAQQQARLARIAGTCAMLIGVGYHTALELVEGALIYTGQNLRNEVTPLTDAGNLLGNGAATDIMTELFDEQTSEEPT